MITPTHVTVNAFVAHRLKGRPLLDSPARQRMFVLGGLAPDVPLILLTVGGAVYYRLRGMPVDASVELMSERLYFESPWWIASYNLLHAPLVLAILFLVARYSCHRWSGPAQAFVAGCMLHTALDIPVHHSDGPLLLFPVDWSLRFHSPVSYWDPAYHGAWIRPVDLGITLLGALALAWWVARRRRASRQTRDDRQRT